SVDELREIFNRLDLVMDGTPAIRFEDPEVLRLLLTEKVGNYQEIAIDSDEDGMLTYEEVAILPTLTQRRDGNQSLFTGNTVIETFNEFRFFTGLEMINSGTFSDCTSLRKVTLPINTALGDSVFANSGIERIIIPEGYQTIGNNLCEKAYQCRLLDIPSTVTSIGASLIWGLNTNNSSMTIICRASTPPKFGGFSGTPQAIYVPDTSVDAYKLVSGWSSQAAKIYPLSTYVEP
ncbi:leucine-rich repeat domain-containing protein, partial [Bacteroides stercorirosoris]